MIRVPSPLPKTSDEWLEHDIKQAGADKAPRVTPADIEANIACEYYFTGEEAIYGVLIREGMENPDPDYDPFTGGPPEFIEEMSLLTFCVLVLKSGFTVTGESACASPENFNAEIGRKIARENAINKVWPLMGYALKEQLSKGLA